MTLLLSIILHFSRFFKISDLFQNHMSPDLNFVRIVFQSSFKLFAPKHISMIEIWFWKNEMKALFYAFCQMVTFYLKDTDLDSKNMWRLICDEKSPFLADQKTISRFDKKSDISLPSLPAPRTRKKSTWLLWQNILSSVLPFLLIPESPWRCPNPRRLLCYLKG